MTSTRLIFDQQRPAAGNPVRLVFGAGGDAEVPVYALSAQGRITGLRGQVCMASVLHLRARGRITGLRGSVAMAWNVNVSRPVVAHALDSAQSAQSVRAAVHSMWQQAQRNQEAVQQIWKDARHVAAQVQGLWQQAQPLRGAGRDTQQDAAPVRHGVSARFEQAVRLHAAAVDAMRDAQALRSAALAAFQQAVRLRAVTQAHMQQGVPVAGHWLTRFAHGLPVRVDMHGRFEQATQPGPGLWLWPQPAKPRPCYVPELPARLVFDQAYTPGLPAALVFRCRGKTPDPQPTPHYVIPLLPVYMQVHHLTAHLLPGMDPVPLTELTLAADDDGYGWSLAANGPEHLLDQLAPVAGLPAQVQVVINGMAFVFAITSAARSRSFERKRVAVQGVSVTALLGAPYMPQQSWLSTAPATAQQLAVQALEFTGVGLDWQIADWLVPAGAWSYQGTPLQAVLRVAESVGAVVRSHPTAAQLIVAPRYPVLPWHWADATPDVQMPAAVIATDELRPEPRADYNAIYVTGGSVGGVQGHVVRALSARDKLAPAVQDDLITHADAARLRGQWALAASGNKLLHTISMPVLTGGTNPGIVRPGQLLEVVDTDGTWRGLVRGVNVSATLPRVRQQLTVERVAA
ncbi:hypothetical protein N5D67_01070 [Comamonas aquatica]|uniref:hypothetical protein n=1 Tax=Comamonas aquatica TaxID=225991 RepID=UPI00244C17EE|nr:hypothetical protein [Comamonas aquatica]MDH1900901.1 hypothetical protein [Comamonas aquatica]